jgi:bifunctional DNA-binding transcriptional regulator/antitoxin component of YhaV-PrlF toxin-antitoxin module
MSAPPGFNETSSNLPDPGPSSAPIHVMRGGGVGGSSEDFEILKEYGLNEGGILEKELTEEEKQIFLKQIKNGVCEKANGILLKNDCSMVAKVTRLLIEACMNNTSDAPCKRVKKQTNNRMATQVINPLAVLSKGPAPTSTPASNVVVMNPLQGVKNKKVPAFVKGMTKKNNTGTMNPLQGVKRNNKNIPAFLTRKNNASKNVITMNPLAALKTQRKNAVVPPPIPVDTSTLNPAFATSKPQKNTTSRANKVPFWKMFSASKEEPSLPGSVPAPAPAPAPITAPPPISIPPLSASSSFTTPPLSLTASPVSTAQSENNIFISEPAASNYLNNPPNFQEGIVRMNFTKPVNKQVFANAKFGSRKVRVFGKNTSNIRSRYNSRKAKYSKELEEMKRIAEYAAKEEEQRRINLQRAKTEYETRLGMQKSMQKASKKQARNVSKFESEVIKPKSMMNRFKGLFKRSGRKTRKNNRK